MFFQHIPLRSLKTQKPAGGQVWVNEKEFSFEKKRFRWRKMAFFGG